MADDAGATAGPHVPGTDQPPVAHAYRPYLDGLRAVAVYLVLLFHAGVDRFPGGFIGVDVFFVLSGFLVTQLLLRDLDGTGRVSLRRFYARRVRRLLPAAGVALLVTAVVFSALATPVEVAEAEGAFRASFLYSANWYFIWQSSDYFGADVSGNPVLHFWSLAVEEQFYLLWPLVLGGLFLVTRRFGARRRSAVRVVVAFLAVASLAWAWALRDSDPAHAYYGTDARAYQLMAGALLALTPGLFARVRGHAERALPAVGLAAMAALIFIASSGLDVGPIERGALTTAVCLVLLVALESATGGPLLRALAVQPVVYLGKISYSTYLWHWPVILVIGRTADLSVLSTTAIAALVATALASLSFELLETPIRASALLDRFRTPVIATGLALSAIGGLVVIPNIVDRSNETVSQAPNATPATTGFTPVPAGIDWAAIRADIPTMPNCAGEAPTACTLVEGAGPHVLLLGDSHAGMLEPALIAVAEQEDLTLSVDVHSECPWQRDIVVANLDGSGRGPAADDCEVVKDDAYDRVLPALQPDVVILVNAPYANRSAPFVGPDGSVPERGTEAFDTLVEESTRTALAELQAAGARVVLVEPIPVSLEDVDPVECLSAAEVIEACRFVVDARATPIEDLYRELQDERDDVWAADLDQIVCPFLPICDPILDQQVVRRDRSHLSSPFSRSLAPTIAAYLRDNAILRSG